VIGIYAIRSKANEKIYIGKSKNIAKRWPYHRKDLKLNKHKNRYLQNDWNAFGEDNFEVLTIEECSIDDLRNKEDYWIKYYKNLDIAYNIDNVFSRAPEINEKVSNTLRGRKHDPKVVEKRNKSLIGKNAGERHYKSKLTDEQVQEIKGLLNQGYTGKELSKLYNVSGNVISGIKHGTRKGGL
jgi:group I intron endonuclease